MMPVLLIFWTSCCQEAQHDIFHSVMKTAAAADFIGHACTATRSLFSHAHAMHLGSILSMKRNTQQLQYCLRLRYNGHQLIFHMQRINIQGIVAGGASCRRRAHRSWRQLASARMGRLNSQAVLPAGTCTIGFRHHLQHDHSVWRHKILMRNIE